MTNNFREKANFIWQVADDTLRGAFKAHEYGDVILPFVVLRGLEMGCQRTAQPHIVLDENSIFINTLHSPFPI